MSPPQPGNNPKWKQTGNVPGPPRPGPVVKVRGPTLELQALKFKNTTTLYPNSSTHKIAKGNLDGWSKADTAFSGPEWVAKRANNFPAALVRKTTIALDATMSWPPASAVKGFLIVSPILRMGTRAGGTVAVTMTTVAIPFSIAGGTAAPTIAVELSDALPDTVGGYLLELSWDAQPQGDPSAFSFTPMKTEHVVFTLYGTPFDADGDSTERNFSGKSVGKPDTVTGTPRRFDKLMSLFGPDMNHPVTTDAELYDLIWRMHTGINDHQNPPYFDAIHDRHLTVDGGATKHFDEDSHQVMGSDPLPVDDQWLMWLTTPTPHWNTAACIGYVQLIKTAGAAAGIFVRRAWVVPHTLELPNGTKIPFNDADLWCLGEEDSSKWQHASLQSPDGKSRTTTLVLMEPNRGGERFEACLFTPDRRFLPGGYTTTGVEKDAPGFISGHGFISALAVLQWWCRTKRGAFQRFMCWVDLGELDGDGKPIHFWDRDGKYYAAAKYEDIVRTGKQVPPPPQAPAPVPPPPPAP